MAKFEVGDKVRLLGKGDCTKNLYKHDLTIGKVYEVSNPQPFNDLPLFYVWDDSGGHNIILSECEYEAVEDSNSAIDTQVGGDHYNMPIQVFEYIAANREHLDGLQGAILKDSMKYLVRHPNKGGMEDIDKVIHLNKLYKELLEKYPLDDE